MRARSNAIVVRATLFRHTKGGAISKDDRYRLGCQEKVEQGKAGAKKKCGWAKKSPFFSF
jgi:hypothetical protein